MNKLEKEASGSPMANLADTIMFDLFPILMDQKPGDSDGRFEQNREYLLEDISNDEIARTSTEDIITRSGFEVRTHKVIADDGYITNLYNIINPLADPTALKQPPVMIMHGATVNPSIYVVSSAIQHHPEKYPRTREDRPITSWNRSLAFTLANNGYDVWLVGTRGSSPENQGRIKIKKIGTAFTGSINDNNMSTSESSIKFSKNSFNYWDFSTNELIQYEVPRQLDKILELTGARNVSLFTYSFSAAPIALPLLASRPDIAKNKIHNYIAMAPILNLDSSNTLAKLVCKIVPFISAKLGTQMVSRLLLTRSLRDLMVLIGESKVIRYSLIKFLNVLVYGSSGKYRTLLEPSILGHVFEPVSFRQLHHFCQNANAGQFQKYDYGARKNKLVYGQAKPPAYDVSNIHVKNWMLISGENDNLSPTSAIEQILEEVNPKPLKHVKARGMNHVDLVAAFDVDKQVVQPVVKFLNRFAILP